MEVNGYEITSGADLSGANLMGADLRGADLRGADLRGADLRMADLRGADLRRADLRGAYLMGADLRWADLMGAHLSGAHLNEAHLNEAHLMGVNLRGADLTGACLTGACLTGAKLGGAKLPNFSLVPERGSFIGYKQLSGGTICELLIPEDAERTSSLVGRKCRASKALVLEGQGSSLWDPDFKYVPGEIVTPREPFDGDIRIECASGIHFFITRKEAEEY